MPKRSDRDILLDKVPMDGTAIGNVSLIKLLDWQDERYWSARSQLLEDGIVALGRGRGGSIYRVEATAKKSKNQSRNKYPNEKSLYVPFADAMGKGFTKDKGIKNSIIQITANQGRKVTGGRWTRPDVVMVSVNTYSYLFGKILDVISFEIKPAFDFEITGVFETAAHSRFATKSYLCVHLPDGWDELIPENERIKSECERFGVGLIYFTEPSDYATYEVLVEPKRWNPDPADTDLFISTQINERERKKISEYLH